MKFVSALAVLAVVCVLGSGCATSYPMGSFYTQLKLPVAVTGEQVKMMKSGTAECTSFLSLVATGDASVSKAAENGKITKIHHVDWEVENILGIIGKYKCIVYGE